MEFLHQAPADYRPKIYTDGSYKELDHDIHTIFEETAVRKQAQAGVVIVHDGPDWKERPMFTMHISAGEDIGACSAHTMKYIALAVTMELQQRFKTTQISPQLHENEKIHKRDFFRTKFVFFCHIL